MRFKFLVISVMLLFLIPVFSSFLSYVKADEMTIQPCQYNGGVCSNHPEWRISSQILSTGGSHIHRIFIKYDLSSIPAGSNITSAVMKVYSFMRDSSPQTRYYHAFQITEYWDESTMNWTTQPTYDSTVVDNYTVPITDGVWHEWNITSTAQKWMDGHAPNYGIRVNDSREGYAPDSFESSYYRFRTYSDTSLRPKLIVTYTPPSAPPQKPAFLVVNYFNGWNGLGIPFSTYQAWYNNTSASQYRISYIPFAIQKNQTINITVKDFFGLVVGHSYNVSIGDEGTYSSVDIVIYTTKVYLRFSDNREHKTLIKELDSSNTRLTLEFPIDLYANMNYSAYVYEDEWIYSIAEWNLSDLNEEIYVEFVNVTLKDRPCVVYYSLYNNFTGEGLNIEKYKIYSNYNRTFAGEFHCNYNDSVTTVVKDYFDVEIYNSTKSIDDESYFWDVPLNITKTYFKFSDNREHETKISVREDIFVGSEDGYIIADDWWGGDYNGARDGSLGLTVNTGSATAIVGQNDGGGWNYQLWRYYISFDTSMIPDDGSVLSAELYLVPENLGGTQADFDVQVIQYNWGDTLTTADWNCITGTLEGTLANTSDMLTQKTYSMDLSTSYISKTGKTHYVIVSKEDRMASPPTSAENMYFYSGDTTTAYKPYLVVSYLEMSIGESPVELFTDKNYSAMVMEDDWIYGVDRWYLGDLTSGLSMEFVDVDLKSYPSSVYYNFYDNATGEGKPIESARVYVKDWTELVNESFDTEPSTWVEMNSISEYYLPDYCINITATATTSQTDRYYYNSTTFTDDDDFEFSFDYKATDPPASSTGFVTMGMFDTLNNHRDFVGLWHRTSSASVVTYLAYIRDENENSISGSSITINFNEWYTFKGTYSSSNRKLKIEAYQNDVYDSQSIATLTSDKHFEVKALGVGNCDWINNLKIVKGQFDNAMLNNVRYVNERVHGGLWSSDVNAYVRTIVQDYFGNEIYNVTKQIPQATYFWDIPIDIYSFKVHDSNEDVCYMRIYYEGSGTPMSFYTAPYETVERWLRGGNYTICVTYYENYVAGDTVYFNYTVDSADYILIEGTTLYYISSQVKDVYAKQEIITNMLTPDVLWIGEDLPLCPTNLDIMTDYGCIYIHPYAVVEATTYNNKSGTNSSFWNPAPTSGTINIIQDKLYISGDYDVEIWINDTSNNNIYNSTTNPMVVYLNGQNITVWSNKTITCSRETTWRQTELFYWAYYTTQKLSTVTLTLNNTIFTNMNDVYWFVPFADNVKADLDSVKVFDNDNGVYLDVGEHYDVSSGGLHLWFTDLSISQARTFTFSYYDWNASANIYIPIIEISTYTRQEYVNEDYYLASGSWDNNYAIPYEGDIVFKLTFDRAYLIDVTDIIVHDGSRVLNENEWYYSGNSLTISQRAIGELGIGEEYSIKIYFKFTSEAVPSIGLFSPLFYLSGFGISPYIILWIVMIIAVILTVTTTDWYKQREYQTIAIIGFSSIIIIGILNQINVLT